jgi:hypothetical protein
VSSNSQYNEELIKNHGGHRVSQRKKLKFIETPCYSVFSVVIIVFLCVLRAFVRDTSIKVSSAITDD